MNQLLLLGGLVLALYVMNEKKVFSGLSKTLSSGKNNTMLVLVFCGVILFMCMQKGKVMEYFTVESNTGKGVCDSNTHTKMHIYDPTDPDPDKHLPICVEKVSESDRVIQAIDGLVKRLNNNQDDPTPPPPPPPSNQDKPPSP
jgi:hypothetical protein